MAFVKNLAKGGMFGLSGLLATSGDKNKPRPSPQSLVTGDYPASSPSLLNSKNGY